MCSAAHVVGCACGHVSANRDHWWIVGRCLMNLVLKHGSACIRLRAHDLSVGVGLL